MTKGASPGRGRAGLRPEVSMGPDPTWNQEGPDKRSRSSALGRQGRVRSTGEGSEDGQLRPEGRVGKAVGGQTTGPGGVRELVRKNAFQPRVRNS